MQGRIEIVVAGHAPVRGDWQSLLDQVGIAQATVTLDSLATWLDAKRPADRAGLRRFLDAYRDEQLVPLELPAIRDAFQHAVRGESRELIAMDLCAPTAPVLEAFRLASHRAGRDQLRRLRPLRDFRVAQRYLQAVENGKAQGWHTLAYGVTLAAYAVPLREGLLHFARATLRSFAENAARPMGLAEAELNALLDELCLPVGLAVDALIGALTDVPASGPV